MNKLLLTITVSLSLNTFAKGPSEDPRDQAVKNSPVILKTIEALKSEQRLSCALTQDESGETTIQYFVEQNLSKFKALYLCNDGRSAVFTGVIGDGGQTATEKFELMTAQ